VVAEVEGDNRSGRVKVFVFAGASRSVRRGPGSQRESAASPRRQASCGGSGAGTNRTTSRQRRSEVECSIETLDVGDDDGRTGDSSSRCCEAPSRAPRLATRSVDRGRRNGLRRLPSSPLRLGKRRRRSRREWRARRRLTFGALTGRRQHSMCRLRLGIGGLGRFAAPTSHGTGSTRDEPQKGAPQPMTNAEGCGGDLQGWAVTRSAAATMFMRTGWNAASVSPPSIRAADGSVASGALFRDRTRRGSRSKV
jgi:hypothetical protein